MSDRFSGKDKKGSYGFDSTLTWKTAKRAPTPSKLIDPR